MKKFLGTLVAFGLVLTPVAATAHPAAPGTTAHGASSAHAPTLGAPGAYGKYGRGWGEVTPRRIYNGGDPSGIADHLHWTGWGHSVAHGTGKTYAFKPHGGYFKRQVVIKLKAVKIKRCPSTGRLAYSQLKGREQTRPGGHFGSAFLWNGNHNLCHTRTP